MISIGIPSKGRPDLLSECIRSIQGSTYHQWESHICITCWGDLDLYVKEESYETTNIFVHLHPDLTVVECQNWVAARTKYANFLPISDDVKFEPKTLEIAERQLRFKFKDTDGVVGLNQYDVPGGTDTAFLLIGKKFLSRFPNYQPFCPDYKHFAADTELGNFSKKLGLYSFCQEARVEHLHPCTGKRGIDDTHTQSRRFLQEDLALFKKRKEQNLVWGRP